MHDVRRLIPSAATLALGLVGCGTEDVGRVLDNLTDVTADTGGTSDIGVDDDIDAGGSDAGGSDSIDLDVSGGDAIEEVEEDGSGGDTVGGDTVGGDDGDATEGDTTTTDTSVDVSEDAAAVIAQACAMQMDCEGYAYDSGCEDEFAASVAAAATISADCEAGYLAYLGCLGTRATCYDGYLTGCDAEMTERFLGCYSVDDAIVEAAHQLCAAQAECDPTYTEEYCFAGFASELAEIVSSDPDCAAAVQEYLDCLNTNGECVTETYDGETYSYLQSAEC
ncbi:MAG: hypothetical protein H6698_09785, partial [Myxococcales bacterium]|nr:hypothetical protein [Myxococcales bacterium]